MMSRIWHVYIYITTYSYLYWHSSKQQAHIKQDSNIESAHRIVQCSLLYHIIIDLWKYSLGGQGLLFSPLSNVHQAKSGSPVKATLAWELFSPVYSCCTRLSQGCIDQRWWWWWWWRGVLLTLTCRTVISLCWCSLNAGTFSLDSLLSLASTYIHSHASANSFFSLSLLLLYPPPPTLHWVPLNSE